MTEFDCPEHGNLVPDLARGRLGDAPAKEAEQARLDCAVCSRWWDETFSDPALAELDAEVASVFRDFVPPRRSRRGWMAAAAAAVLVIGGGTASLMLRDAEIATSNRTMASNTEAVLSAWDFEEGDARSDEMTGEKLSARSDEIVFGSDLESGDLSSWSFHTN